MLVLLGLVSCSTLPREGARWQDEVRSEIISTDTGGVFAYETPEIRDSRPERYTYTHSVTGQGPWFRAWWDVRLLAEDTDNVDLSDAVDDHETTILWRARLDLDGGAVVRPWDVHLELQDSRDISNTLDYAKNALDVRRLYLFLGSAYTLYGIKLGRFAPTIGSGRIWGSNEDDNVAGTFDGVLLTLADAFHYREPRYCTWRIDTWYVKPVVPEPVSPDTDHAPYDIYGANIEHRVFWPITLSAGFVGREWKHDEAGETGTGPSASFDVTGRAFGYGLERGFDFDAEASLQLGRQGGDNLSAWFLYGQVGHTFPTPWRPRIGARLTWGSGDENPTDGRIHTYRAGSSAVRSKEMGFTGLLGWSNCVTYQVELSMQPVERLSVNTAARFGFLDSEIQPWYDRTGSIVLQDPTGAAGGDIGYELDLWVEYAPKDFWRVRVGCGKFVPGKMPEALGNDDSAEVFFIELNALF